MRSLDKALVLLLKSGPDCVYPCSIRSLSSVLPFGIWGAFWAAPEDAGVGAGVGVEVDMVRGVAVQVLPTWLNHSML